MRAWFLCLLPVSFLSAQNHVQVDALFERFSGKSPGCAVGVTQDGKVLLSKAYGLADLEHDIPLSPKSMFYMASVSKQFAAMSILLLRDEGRLQFTDPVRQTIPELPDHMSGITLYHLLTHTSGVRDYLTLGSLAGRPMMFTDQSVLRLISRQEALNFDPGSEFLYSNSGYVLLSMVVKAVTRGNLNEFARERIFLPLGMTSTRFQHDHSALVPGKALGYVQGRPGWNISNSMLDVVGDGGLYSSVEDMFRWMENFDKPKIGATALALMQTPGRLSNGTEIGYGMGLIPSQYRGRRIVEHSGSLGGYRTEFLRFPDQKLSVICLCNNGLANASQLARQVAELYLPPETKSSQPAAQPALPVVNRPAEEPRSPERLPEVEMGSYAGEYLSRELNTTYRITVEKDTLVVEPGDGPQRSLRTAGRDLMRAEQGGLEFVFQRDSGGRVVGFHLNAGRVRGLQFRRM